MSDQLTTAQLTKALALPLHRQEMVKMLFLLLDKGMALETVIDFLSEVQQDVAATRAELPERVCAGCGQNFTPHRRDQTYHSAQCRGNANAKKTYQRKHHSPGEEETGPQIGSQSDSDRVAEYVLGPSITKRNEPKKKSSTRSKSK
tara:strand:+ start:196 stop:633 length:438 start_codon:yes stop_codon:yes gene_type:complete